MAVTTPRRRMCHVQRATVRRKLETKRRERNSDLGRHRSRRQRNDVDSRHILVRHIQRRRVGRERDILKRARGR